MRPHKGVIVKLTRLYVLTVIVAVLALVAATVPALAGIPAKSELSLSGTYIRPKGADATYAVDFALAAPLNQGGSILLGPKLRYSSNDAENAIGAVGELNFSGTKGSGFYLGANGLYNLKEVAGTERYSVNGDAGFKFALGKGGSGFKIFAEQPIAGRDKDLTDRTFNAGLLVRF